MPLLAERSRYCRSQRADNAAARRAQFTLSSHCRSQSFANAADCSVQLTSPSPSFSQSALSHVTTYEKTSMLLLAAQCVFANLTFCIAALKFKDAQAAALQLNLCVCSLPCTGVASVVARSIASPPTPFAAWRRLRRRLQQSAASVVVDKGSSTPPLRACETSELRHRHSFGKGAAKPFESTINSYAFAATELLTAR
eukprot:3100237-Pleurochrysis_carterae.AAC.1